MPPPVEPELDEADMEEFADLDTLFMADAAGEVATTAKEYNDDLEDWSDRLDLEEKSAEQKAIVKSYELLKKL
jgi:hypothetical protein